MSGHSRSHWPAFADMRKQQVVSAGRQQQKFYPKPEEIDDMYFILEDELGNMGTGKWYTLGIASGQINQIEAAHRSLFLVWKGFFRFNACFSAKRGQGCICMTPAQTAFLLMLTRTGNINISLRLAGCAHADFNGN